MKRILVALLLSACGSPAPEGADAGDVPDASPPVLVSLSPEDGATDVALDAVVSVTFDRAVDVAIELVDDRGDAIAGTLDGATFTPARLEAERRYTASASAGGDVITWSFSTRARAWSPGARIGGGGKPSIAVDAAGNAFAAWIQDDGTAERPMTSRFTPASGWSEPVSLDNDAGDWSRDVAIAADASGDAIAIWQQYNYDVGPEVMLWTNRFVVGQGWGVAVRLEAGEDPRLGFDAAGNALAVWDSAVSSSVERVRAARYVAGVGWEAPVFLHPDDTGSGGSARIAVRADGSAVAVWTQLVDPQYSVFASRYTPGAGWSAAELLEHDDDAGAAMPQVAADAAGNAIAVWRVNEASLAASRFTPAGGWSAPISLETTSGWPQLAVARTGEAIAIWSEGGVWTRRFDPSDGWAAPVQLADSNADAEVGFDGAGRAVAIWTDSAGATARRLEPAGWSVPITLSTGATYFQEAHLAVTPAGDAVAVWQQDTEVWSSALR